MGWRDQESVKRMLKRHRESEKQASSCMASLVELPFVLMWAAIQLAFGLAWAIISFPFKLLFKKK